VRISAHLILRSILMNMTFSYLQDSCGTIGPREWKALQNRKWANDGIIVWCCKSVSHLTGKYDNMSLSPSSYIKEQVATTCLKTFHIMSTWFLPKWTELSLPSASLPPMLTIIHRNPDHVVSWRGPDIFTLDFLIFPMFAGYVMAIWWSSH
jgi:hypothetical protein